MRDWATDQIYTDVEVRLSTADRLRVLFRGQLSVRVTVDTENRPGRVASDSRLTVPRLRWRRQKGAYATEAQR